ncbi:class I glutamine amidotransferase-like protein [Rhizoctonia solani]|nr:class I glutamine amidotransferase-like protein [Rhizoctonia solani]
MTDTKVLTIAVVLCQGVTILDYQGPMEILETASVNSLAGPWLQSIPGFPNPKVKFECEFVAESLEPIRGTSGPMVVASKTFDEVLSKQFDIIMIPAGAGAPWTRQMWLRDAGNLDHATATPTSFDSENIPKPVAKFLLAQVPGAQYIFSVCAGSWILAALGLLDGRQATTNKSSFDEIKKSTSPAVQWIAKARWVIDGKFWTSSGVTAGQDMAYEFLKTVAGQEFATAAKNAVELRAASADDDEFADVFHLV